MESEPRRGEADFLGWWWQPGGRAGMGEADHCCPRQKGGHWKQLSAPVLESNSGSERGSDLPKVTQRDKAD